MDGSEGTVTLGGRTLQRTEGTGMLAGCTFWEGLGGDYAYQVTRHGSGQWSVLVSLKGTVLSQHVVGSGSEVDALAESVFAGYGPAR